MREKYGNSVFVPDTSKPGGGIWVASSRDEMLQSGLPQGDQVLKEDFPSRARGTLDQRALHTNGYNSGNVTHTGTGTGTGSATGSGYGSGSGVITPNRADFNIADQDALLGMQNTTNVNPNINDVGIPIDPNLQMGGGGQQDVGSFSFRIWEDTDRVVVYGFDQFRRV